MNGAALWSCSLAVASGFLDGVNGGTLADNAMPNEVVAGPCRGPDTACAWGGVAVGALPGAAKPGGMEKGRAGGYRNPNTALP